MFVKAGTKAIQKKDMFTIEDTSEYQYCIVSKEIVDQIVTKYSSSNTQWEAAEDGEANDITWLSEDHECKGIEEFLEIFDENELIKFIKKCTWGIDKTDFSLVSDNEELFKYLMAMWQSRALANISIEEIKFVPFMSDKSIVLYTDNDDKKCIVDFVKKYKLHIMKKTIETLEQHVINTHNMLLEELEGLRRDSNLVKILKEDVI